VRWRLPTLLPIALALVLCPRATGRALAGAGLREVTLDAVLDDSPATVVARARGAAA
jgi:hypothetical protein